MFRKDKNKPPENATNVEISGPEGGIQPNKPPVSTTHRRVPSVTVSTPSPANIKQEDMDIDHPEFLAMTTGEAQAPAVANAPATPSPAITIDGNYGSFKQFTQETSDSPEVKEARERVSKADAAITEAQRMCDKISERVSSIINENKTQTPATDEQRKRLASALSEQAKAELHLNDMKKEGQLARKQQAEIFSRIEQNIYDDPSAIIDGQRKIAAQNATSPRGNAARDSRFHNMRLSANQQPASLSKLVSEKDLANAHRAAAPATPNNLTQNQTSQLPSPRPGGRNK